MSYFDFKWWGKVTLIYMCPSWLNQIEIWFGIFSRKVLHGVLGLKALQSLQMRSNHISNSIINCGHNSFGKTGKQKVLNKRYYRKSMHLNTNLFIRFWKQEFFLEVTYHSFPQIFFTYRLDSSMKISPCDVDPNLQNCAT